MTTLQIRLEDELRENAAAVAKGMGIDFSSAIRMFLAQMVRENGMPFRPTNDPFHSPSNMRALSHSLHQLQAEETVTKSLEELEAMEKD